MKRNLSSREILVLTALALLAFLAIKTTMVEASRRVRASDASCLRACHLCRQMYGTHFRGHLCAHTCVRMRGALAPDCANFASIAPYLDVDQFLDDNDSDYGDQDE